MHKYLVHDQLDTLTQRLYQQGWFKACYVSPVCTDLTTLKNYQEQALQGTEFKIPSHNSLQLETHINFTRQASTAFIPVFYNNHFIVVECGASDLYIDPKGDFNPKTKSLTQVNVDDAKLLYEIDFFIECNPKLSDEALFVQLMNNFDTLPVHDLDMLKKNIESAKAQLEFDCQSRQEIFNKVTKQLPKLKFHSHPNTFQDDDSSCGYLVILSMLLRADNKPLPTEPLSKDELDEWISECTKLLHSPNYKIRLPQSLNQSLKVALPPPQQQPSSDNPPSAWESFCAFFCCADTGASENSETKQLILSHKKQKM